MSLNPLSTDSRRTKPVGVNGRVVVVGGSNIDISVQSNAALHAADSNPGRIQLSPGGVARNVAENLLRLGHAVRLFSAVGNDLMGQMLEQSCSALGLEWWPCLVTAGRTGSYVSLHGPDGDMAVAVNDMEVVQALTPDWLSAQQGAWDEVTAMVLDANLSPESLRWLLLHGPAVPVFVDAVSAVKGVRLVPWLSKIHTLKLNAIELDALCPLDLALEQTGDVLRGAQWMVQQGVQQAVVTLGARGLVACNALGQTVALPALPVSVVNATGAGDAVLAGLLHGYLQGWSLLDAMHWAQGCAAMTLQSAGANAKNLNELAVQGLLQSHGMAVPSSQRTSANTQ